MLTDSEEPIANTEATRRSGVLINGSPLSAAADSRLLRVVVDNDLLLPDMFELTFLDVRGQLLTEEGIAIGATVTVSGNNTAGAAVPLIVGEVTAIEGLIQGVTLRTVVRGYTADHRLQRARRSRSFLNSTDSDVARTIATAAGLQVGSIVATQTTHAYLAQVNQTDWEFLSARAREIGYELGVDNGQFYFQPYEQDGTGGSGVLGAAGRAPGVLGTVGRAVGSAARALGGGSVTITYPENLISFRPRITAGNLTPDVEVRVWDPMARTTMAQNTPTQSGGATSPNSLGREFAPGLGSAVQGAMGAAASGDLSAAAAGIGAAASQATAAVSSATGGLIGSPVGNLGPAPSPTAHVVADQPFADGTSMATSGPQVAAALSSEFGSTYAEAEGEAKGNAAIQPGAAVNIVGVQSVFAGTWHVSRTRHVFDDSEFGYRVIFSAHGRQDRTVLGLTTKGGKRSEGRGVLDGVVCGVVSNGADPLGKGRVKVTLPWLSPDFETDWAPLAQNYSAQKGGSIYLPEIGDEVLVAFEFGDVRRPYVLGAFMNNLTQWSIAASGPLGAFGLTSITDVLSGQAIGIAGAAAGALIAGPALAPLGAAVGEAVATQAAAAVQSEISGSSLAPGMVTEVHHRGVVSNTGNALLFYDQPPPLPTPSTSDVADAVGLPDTGGGGTGAADASLTHPGMGALGSAVRLGSQGGEFGLTVDQVNGGVTLNAKMIPGVTLNPVPAMNLSTENGFINISAGEMGCLSIDGGIAMSLKASGTITIDAPAIELIGFTTVDGVPVV